MKHCICNDMDGLEGIMLNEINHIQKNAVDFTQIWNLKERKQTK